MNSRSTIDQKQRKDSTENPKKHMKLDRVYSTHHNVGDSYGCTEWRELTAQIAQVIGSEQGDCIKVSQLSLDRLYSQWLCCVLMHTWFVYHCTPDLQVLALVCHNEIKWWKFK